MNRIALAPCFALFALVAPSRALAICPGTPPQLRTIEITSVTPAKAKAGDWVELRGRNFNLLPANTQAWFFSNGNANTAFGEFHRTSSVSGVAQVPAHHVAPGPGQMSLYYFESYDCSAQGGFSNEVSGNWVNSRFLLPFEIEPPPPTPTPVTNLSATAMGSDRIWLRWQDNSNNEDDFQICEGPDRQHTNNCLGTVPANRIQEEITNLPAQATRCYEVRARNRFGFRPVPDDSKACATTLPKPTETGKITTTPIGIDSAFCSFTGTINLFAFKDANSNGIVELAGQPALPNPFPAWLELNGDFAPPWEIAVANQYAPSSSIIVSGNLSSCGPGYPEFFAIHFSRNGSVLTPRFMVAGNLSSRTGPTSESLGWVEIGSEFGQQSATFNQNTGRVSGSVSAFVSFEISAPDPDGYLYVIEAATQITVDFRNGVTVQNQ